jgi:hypothetical protein
VGIVADASSVDLVTDEHTVYELAQRAIRYGTSLEELLRDGAPTQRVDYESLIAEGRILAPVDHPDPAHMLVTGTGLTHLGSADARDRMHRAEAEAVTDSMRMFRLGIEGGKPPASELGVQPEWFYKGDGDSVAAPYQPVRSFQFALDHGEEPEMVGLYLVGPQGHPHRIGFALGNEFSDHVMERQNYLYLAHSKLRPCSFGPEVLLGELPRDVRGTSRVWRDGRILWEKPFVSGEENMSHSIANLEGHHFKYPQFRRPGDAHAHFFGTATLSFADGVVLQAGDEMEIQAEAFGRPLRNKLEVQDQGFAGVKVL